MSEPEKESEFFVGYLPTPVGLGKFYRRVVPLLILIAIGVSSWVALSQKSAGKGEWDSSQVTTMAGILTIDPYPILHMAGDETRSVLLVMQGKHAANSLSQSWAGKAVSISGFAIGRGNWEMLEIRGEQDISAFEKGSTPKPINRLLPKIEPLGKVELSGEIMDSKCFLGVMKPGSGKVHRACAELCLLGGIPPMLVARDPEGKKAGYLLVLENDIKAGSSASQKIAHYAAQPVSLRGSLERRGDLLFIRTKEQDIRPIGTAQLHQTPSGQ